MSRCGVPPTPRREEARRRRQAGAGAAGSWGPAQIVAPDRGQPLPADRALSWKSLTSSASGMTTNSG